MPVMGQEPLVVSTLRTVADSAVGRAARKACVEARVALVWEICKVSPRRTCNQIVVAASVHLLTLHCLVYPRAFLSISLNLSET